VFGVNPPSCAPYQAVAAKPLGAGAARQESTAASRPTDMAGGKLRTIAAAAAGPQKGGVAASDDG